MMETLTVVEEGGMLRGYGDLGGCRYRCDTIILYRIVGERSAITKSNNSYTISYKVGSQILTCQIDSYVRSKIR